MLAAPVFTLSRIARHSEAPMLFGGATRCGAPMSLLVPRMLCGAATRFGGATRCGALMWVTRRSPSRSMSMEKTESLYNFVLGVIPHYAQNPPAGVLSEMAFHQKLPCKPPALDVERSRPDNRAASCWLFNR